MMSSEILGLKKHIKEFNKHTSIYDQLYSEIEYYIWNLETQKVFFSFTFYDESKYLHFIFC